MEHLLNQVQDLSREVSILVTENYKLKARIDDLEIEKAHHRNTALVRTNQYEELLVAYKAIAAHAENLEKRGKANRERIRRMEEGEL